MTIEQLKEKNKQAKYKTDNIARRIEQLEDFSKLHDEFTNEYSQDTIIIQFPMSSNTIKLNYKDQERGSFLMWLENEIQDLKDELGISDDEDEEE